MLGLGPQMGVVSATKLIESKGCVQVGPPTSPMLEFVWWVGFTPSHQLRLGTPIAGIFSAVGFGYTVEGCHWLPVGAAPGCIHWAKAVHPTERVHQGSVGLPGQRQGSQVRHNWLRWARTGWAQPRWTFQLTA